MPIGAAGGGSRQANPQGSAQEATHNTSQPPGSQVRLTKACGSPATATEEIEDLGDLGWCLCCSQPCCTGADGV